MSNAVTDPEKAPVPPDELARLEEMHQRMKEQQEAWRKLLENLHHLKSRPSPGTNTENPETETPSA